MTRQKLFGLPSGYGRILLQVAIIHYFLFWNLPPVTIVCDFSFLNKNLFLILSVFSLGDGGNFLRTRVWLARPPKRVPCGFDPLLR